MTDQMRILFCPFCGCTDVLGDLDDTAKLEITSCEKCRDTDEPENTYDETEHSIDEISFFEGFKRGAKAAIPEGWQVVPKKPTSAMVQSTWSLILRSPETIYAVMLEAAPSPEGQ